MHDNPIERKTSFNWYLQSHPLYVGEELKLDWRTIRWPKDSTKHQREYLLRSSKELMDALVEDLRGASSRPSPNSVLNKFYRLRRLTNWMLSEGKYRFSELTEEDLVSFLRTLVAKGTQDGPVAAKTMKTYASQLQLMWKLRGEYLSPIQIDLHTIECEIASGVKTKLDKKWRALPDNVALPLISNAMHWMTEMAPPLLNVLSVISGRLPSFVGTTKKQRTKILAVIYESLEKDGQFRFLRDAMNDFESNGNTLLRKGIRYLEGACITTILFMVGMRCSELCAMNGGSLSEHQHADGKIFSYLNSVAAKSGGESRRWVAAEPVKEAVRILELLFKGFIPSAKDAPLLNSYNGNSAIPFADRMYGRMNTNAVGNLLKDFAEFTLNEFEEYKDRIHPHAARKTFARFVVRRDKSAFEALAYHYGHVHWLVTDSNYVGTDFDLAELLDEENRAELARCFTELLTSQNISGKAGLALTSMRTSATEGPTFRGKRSLVAVVDQLIERGTQLAPCSWGFCLYTPVLAACQGDDRGPNEVNRSPSLCSTCANFAVTERHRGWWEARSEDDQKFLRRIDIADQARTIVLRRLDQTSALLADLNEKKFNAKSRALK